MPQFSSQPALQGLRKSQPQTTFMPRPGTELLTPEEMAPNPPLSPGGSPIPKDPASTVHLFKDRFKGELQDRLFAAQRTGQTNEANALQGLIGSTEQDLATDPISQQKIQSDAVGKANLDAQLKGFTGGNPRPTGMEPDFPGGRSFTSTPAEMPAQQAGRAGRQMEWYKAGMPAEVAEARGESALSVEQAKTTAAEKSHQQLLDLLRSGVIQPGSKVSLGGGASISTAPPSQMVAAGAGKGLNAELSAKMKLRADLDNPTWFGTTGPKFSEFIGGESIPVKKARLDREIQELQGRITGHTQPVGQPAASPTSDPRRQQAIDALTAAGHPVTEANIQHLLQQIR